MGKKLPIKLALVLASLAFSTTCIAQAAIDLSAKNAALPHSEVDSVPSTDEKKDFRCKVASESDELVDRVRATTHTRLCNAAGWVDALFGNKEEFEGEKFRGKISIGFKEDELEGLDPRLRVRIKTDLPNVSKRFDAFLGKVEEDSYISNTEVNEDRLNNVGLRSADDDDSEWLVGLGYRGPNASTNGWDLSIGAKLSSGVKPYAKVAHHYMIPVGVDSFLKTTQTVFWRDRDGLGVSSTADFTKLIGENDIIVSHGSVKYTEEADQVEWFADTRWHHSFTEKKGISSSIYLRGEAENEVTIPEFGITLTYIQPILREWLYMEVGLDQRWERQFRHQTAYKQAIRFGVQFEMLLGDYYRRKKRK